ncbi:MAG: nicotinamide-nucleotide amidohydrolase family protein [Eubacteriales bacterium]|nr:nicotinamide-nucleotide amidohydrolase family protein [Eubacteriales bacterium]
MEKRRLHPALCRYESRQAVKALASLLMAQGMHITTAESCTGGLIAATLVDVNGMSECFDRGYITYADSAKEAMLGVNPDILKRYGAVSREVAIAMAEGALRVSGADIALSATGIAGPSGGTKEKPVGLVYIACGIKDAPTTVQELRLSGGRVENRHETVLHAFQLAIACIENFRPAALTDK